MGASDKQRLIRGVYIYYFYLIANAGIGILLTPLIINAMGQAAYGLWATFGAIGSYFALMQFGFGSATTKYTAESLATNDLYFLRELVSSSLIIFVFLSCLVFISFCSLTPFLPEIFSFPVGLMPDARWSFLLVGGAVALTILGALPGSIIYGFKKADVQRSVQTLRVLANGLFIIIFTYMGLGLVGLGLAMFLSVALMVLVYFGYLLNSKPQIKISVAFVSIGTIKKITPFSLRTFVLGLSAQVLYRTDEIVIAIILGASTVTPYAVANRLVFTLTFIFTAFASMFFPKFTELYAKRNFKKLQRDFLFINKLTVGAMTPLAICILFFGKQIIILWVGEENFVGSDVLHIFIAMFFIHSLGTCGILLQGIGHNRLFMYSEIINASLNLILSLILIQTMGVFGVALATLIAHLVTSSWAAPLMACHHSRTPVARFILSSIVRPITAGLPVTVITWLYLVSTQWDVSLVTIGLKSMAVILLYCVFFLVIGCNKDDRRRCYKIFSKRLTI